jgi:hypothetical protein
MATKPDRAALEKLRAEDRILHQKLDAEFKVYNQLYKTWLAGEDARRSMLWMTNVQKTLTRLQDMARRKVIPDLPSWVNSFDPGFTPNQWKAFMDRLQSLFPKK